MKPTRKHLIIPLAASIVVTACGGVSVPGTQGAQLEEFGLTQAELVAKVDDVEARIESCMQDAGFDYVAADWPTVKGAMDDYDSGPGLSDEEFTAQYGYGVSTRPDTPAVSVGLGPTNASLLEGLSDGDRQAYLFALLGENPGWTFAIGLEEEDFSPLDGCSAEAVAAVFSIAELDPSYVNPVDAKVDNDPRVVEAIGKWRDCVQAAGFGPFDHPDDPQDEVTERFMGLVGDRSIDELAADEAALLAELQGYERAVAVAAEACDDTHVAPVADAVEEEVMNAG